MPDPKPFDVIHVGVFIGDTLEHAADSKEDLLWAKCDLDGEGMIHLTLRENVNGPGAVRCFRITIEEVDPA